MQEERSRGYKRRDEIIRKEQRLSEKSRGYKRREGTMTMIAPGGSTVVFAISLSIGSIFVIGGFLLVFDTAASTTAFIDGMEAALGLGLFPCNRICIRSLRVSFFGTAAGAGYCIREEIIREENEVIV